MVVLPVGLGVHVLASTRNIIVHHLQARVPIG